MKEKISICVIKDERSKISFAMFAQLFYREQNMRELINKIKPRKIASAITWRGDKSMDKNKNANKLLVGALILGLIGTAAAAGSAAYAYQGDPAVKGPNYSPERHEAMTNAFENNDYNAWKNLMEENSAGRRKRVLDVITEENFGKFAQMRELMIEGNKEEADKIRQELGLGLGQGMHRRADGRGGWSWNR